ncbi:MAG: transposase [Gloeomargarita sp. SKYB31]|nr:transposase [Gloeomargarita sp. SKYB31]
MSRPYSTDLRQKAIEAVLEGATLVEVSQMFNIGYRTLQRWLKQWSETGDCAPKTGYQKGHSHKIKDLDEFRKFVDANPSLTQKEIAAIWGVSSMTICRALKKIGYTRKKNFLLPRARRARAASISQENEGCEVGRSRLHRPIWH